MASSETWLSRRLVFLSSYLQAASAVRGLVGERLTFKVGDGLGHILDSTHLRADSPEGTLEVACGGAAECTIDFVPDGSPFPRIVPIFIHDERHPTRAPLVIPAKLFARPSIPVTTEAGATARMSIGDRIYGPETAGSDGRVRFDVWASSRATARLWSSLRIPSVTSRPARSSSAGSRGCLGAFRPRQHHRGRPCAASHRCSLRA